MSSIVLVSHTIARNIRVMMSTKDNSILSALRMDSQGVVAKSYLDLSFKLNILSIMRDNIHFQWSSQMI